MVLLCCGIQKQLAVTAVLAIPDVCPFRVCRALLYHPVFSSTSALKGRPPSWLLPASGHLINRCWLTTKMLAVGCQLLIGELPC